MGICGEIQPICIAASQQQSLSHNNVSSSYRHGRDSNSQVLFMKIGTDCIGRYHSNYNGTVLTLEETIITRHEKDDSPSQINKKMVGNANVFKW